MRVGAIGAQMLDFVVFSRKAITLVTNLLNAVMTEVENRLKKLVPLVQIYCCHFSVHCSVLGQDAVVGACIGQ